MQAALVSAEHAVLAHWQRPPRGVLRRSPLCPRVPPCLCPFVLKFLLRYRAEVSIEFLFKLTEAVLTLKASQLETSFFLMFINL